jgi:hypothetical protein
MPNGTDNAGVPTDPATNSDPADASRSSGSSPGHDVTGEIRLAEQERSGSFGDVSLGTARGLKSDCLLL